MRTAALAGVALLALAVMPTRALAQDYDAMAKWTDAKVIHYHVVGEWTGTTIIISGQSAVRAKVTDRIEWDFDWDNAEMRVMGQPVIKNFPTKVGTPDPIVWLGMPCPEAKITGAFEYWTMQSAVPPAPIGPSLILDLKGSQDFPAGSVPYGPNSSNTSCGKLWDAVAARSVAVQAKFQVPQAMMLEMAYAAGEIKVSKDKKSFIQDVNTEGWVWTITPTIKK